MKFSTNHWLAFETSIRSYIDVSETIDCFSAVIQAKSYGMNLFYLVFVNLQKDGFLYVKAKGKEQDVIVSVRP